MINILATTARTWGSWHIIPNYEDEAHTIPPDAVADRIDQQWGGKVGLSTQGWLPNSPKFGPLNKYPVLLQIFPADLGWKIEDIPENIAASVEHARDKGFTYVGVTYQTYGGAQPYWYDLRGTYSLYTGDNVNAGEWDKWKMQP